MKRPRATPLFFLLSLAAAIALTLHQRPRESAPKETRTSKPERSQRKAELPSSEASSSKDLGERQQKKAALVKIDEYGTRIYMIDGTQVTVTKRGDLLFLPEKI
ncbi:MAG: hypothetical protein ACOVS5_01580 [Oligoflexus sp.]|jgi:hypothetical protein